MNIDLNNLPNHIAIIMDGNRRWAKKRNLPVIAGHKQGSETLKSIIRGLDEIGIKNVTLYAFSTENWKRSQEEIDGLMNIYRDAIKMCKKEFHKENYKLNFLGSPVRLPEDINLGIKEVIELTKNNKGINIHIALNYGSRDEIMRAIKKMYKDINKIEDINEEVFQKYLDTSGTCDPELVIRTSGEKRLSNFLLWQVAYSELYFIEKYWPDVTIEDLKLAISDFQSRSRRFGGK